MSPPERERLEAFIEEQFPLMFEELQQLKERSVERFNRRMKRIAAEMRRLMETAESNPQRAALMVRERRLDLRIRRLVLQYRRAKDESKRRTLHASIRGLLEEAFDCRHQRRALEIGEFEARLAELRVRHEQALQGRERFIKQALKRRLDDAPAGHSSGCSPLEFAGF